MNRWPEWARIAGERPAHSYVQDSAQNGIGRAVIWKNDCSVGDLMMWDQGLSWLCIFVPNVWMPYHLKLCARISPWDFTWVEMRKENHQVYGSTVHSARWRRMHHNARGWCTDNLDDKHLSSFYWRWLTASTSVLNWLLKTTLSYNHINCPYSLMHGAKLANETNTSGSVDPCLRRHNGYMYLVKRFLVKTNRRNIKKYHFWSMSRYSRYKNY